ncbi:glycosyltransferase family 2 protein [Halomonas urumqiensis]|uniref:Glycosyltransferase family 2 protein n=2 Tax=Halomonas urumqiensis TaxID=1684789 RepID=A0A2N7UDY0_9GAMM|nr:glycosyltransferase family 2 protein [Halomonas urumqiensis]PTB04285.1 glycosyltransferase family 2 protein [Halomonas urumqiensis]
MPVDAQWRWHATGERPVFELRRHLPLPGWHMLEVAMAHDRCNVAMRMHLEFGGCNEPEDVILLPLKHGRITKQLFFVRPGLKALYLAPMEAGGYFTFLHFRIAWLTPRFAHDRLARRLARLHETWRGMPQREVLSELKQQARRQKIPWCSLALDRYRETFVWMTPLDGYSHWLKRRHELGADSVRRIVEKLPCAPTISVLVPVFDPVVTWLRECLESVLTQSYPHWQLCVADDASTNPEVHKLLEEFAERDSRVVVVYRPRNGHICAATNSALAVAQGEFIALLDHDDRLPHNALFHVAEALHRHPEACVLYSDEDKIDEHGVRFDPHFKPDWNPDLLLAQNYISHLGVYRASLVKRIGGFREGFEGSQDHDLLLRATVNLSPTQVVHIPHVLYHWRAACGSTALGSDQKSYSAEAGLAAVNDHLLRHTPGARAEPGRYPNTYRVHWPLPDSLPLVSLLVPTRDRIEILRPCVDAILERTEYANLELLILDNQSECAETLAFMRDVESRDSRVRVLRWEHAFNYSAINNFGARHARGEILGLVNNDIEPIDEGWLGEMVSQVCRPEIGCVGAKLYYPNDTIQHAGVILGIGGVAGHSHKYLPREAPGYFSRLHLAQGMSAVTAACLLVRREVFERVGGLNEAELPVAFNDVDFCLRVRGAGFRNLWTPYAELYHNESLSRGRDDDKAKKVRAASEVAYMRRTWTDQLVNDPAYNPNLTLEFEDFSLR